MLPEKEIKQPGTAGCVCVCVWNFSREVKLVPTSPALYLFIYLFLLCRSIYLFIYVFTALWIYGT